MLREHGILGDGCYGLDNGNELGEDDDDDAYVIDNDISQAVLVFKIKEGGKRG